MGKDYRRNRDEQLDADFPASMAAAFVAAGFRQDANDSDVEGPPEVAVVVLEEDAAPSTEPSADAAGDALAESVTKLVDVVAEHAAGVGADLAAQVTASPPAPPALLVPAAPKTERRGPAHAAARDLVSASAAPTERPKKAPRHDGEASLPVADLFGLPGDELARLTKQVYAEGRNPVFRFFLKKNGRTELVMGIVPVKGDSIMLTVVAGDGWLVEYFPVGIAISLEEVRNAVESTDVGRLRLIANFRGVMQMLLMEHLRSLSEKLTACQRRRTE